MRIALSGFTGCGNTTVTQLLSKKLGYPYYNYTLTDLSKEMGLTLIELHELAKQTTEYDLLLDKKQIQFMLDNENAIDGTRLAVFIPIMAPKLDMKLPKIDFYFWLTARQNIRAERVAKRNNVSYDEALKEIQYRDSENKHRYYDLYGIEFKQPDYCTVIDTEKYDAEGVADKIISIIKPTFFAGKSLTKK
ncbi:(d)CMP kinase [Candidatus Micrarchaeota archaeon]|nr:(d)CMP kinase [Candidatus Micrarchaeota archaeon]